MKNPLATESKKNHVHSSHMPQVKQGSKKLIKLHHPDGSLIDTTQEACELSSEEFQKVFIREPDNIIPSTHGGLEGDHLQQADFIVEDIKNILTRL